MEWFRQKWRVVGCIGTYGIQRKLITLLNEGFAFVKRDMKTMWKKQPIGRLEFTDFSEDSVFRALVNALIHRDYLVNSSEIHIDIFDNRLEIYSPGGMPDGSFMHINTVSSVRKIHCL